MTFSHSVRQEVKKQHHKPGGRDEIMVRIEKIHGVVMPDTFHLILQSSPCRTQVFPNHKLLYSESEYLHSCHD